ncbi:MAG: tRNA (adenosine(37)-N6)-threonylcarbamoyltransferase complex ATPase subunit type 1 TsaE [Candidatus Nucleicultricaceae bacterium]|jgi:tRNA threonylcarbamoyladenosine biosynthesis protein TsaE
MIQLMLSSLSETEQFAEKLGKRLEQGDVVFLKGTLGAGKTAFARFLIQSLMGRDMEVPSPTFTLVQVYEAPRLTLWHFDLYRLTTADEVWELGLEEALAEGASLIEWPERLGAFTMPHLLVMTLTPVDEHPESRLVTLEPSGRWVQKLEGLAP